MRAGINKFADFDYQREPILRIQRRYEAVIGRLGSAGSVAAASDALAELAGYRERMQANRRRARLLHGLDITDDRWRREQEWLDRTEGELLQLEARLGTALAQSPHFPALRERIGYLACHRLQCIPLVMRPDTEALWAEEHRLRTLFADRVRALRVPWEGEERSLAALGPGLESTDRARRQEALDALLFVVREQVPAFIQVLESIIKVRHRIGDAAGLADPMDAWFAWWGRELYTPDQVEQWSNQVADRILPQLLELHRVRAHYLQTSGLVLLQDERIHHPEGNARPRSSSAAGVVGDIIQALKDIGVEEEVLAPLQRLRRYSFHDLWVRQDKDPQTMAADLMPFGAPYIMASYDHTSTGMLALMRAAGQALAMGLRREAQQLDGRTPLPELAEFPGLALPILLWPALGRVADRPAALQDQIITELLHTIMESLALHAFEWSCYLSPMDEPISPQFWWYFAQEELMPWRLLEEQPAHNDVTWILGRLPVEQPGRALDRALSALVALQLWARVADDPAWARDTWLKVCRLGGNLELDALGTYVPGLVCPFQLDRMDKAWEALVRHTDWVRK